MKETYLQLKRRHEKELNNFKGIFYAFSDQQFKEGMKKIGLKEDEKDKLYSIGSSRYILKTRIDDFRSTLKRLDDERKTALKDEKFLLSALKYELMNHEFVIEYDTKPALEALGLEESEIPSKILEQAKTSACNIVGF